MYPQKKTKTAVECKNHLCLLRMISAASTPGIQPSRVSINTMRIEPHPLSITARGGNNIDNKTLQILILQDPKIQFFPIRRP